MPRMLTKHMVRIKCDCERMTSAHECDAEDFVSYSTRGVASKQAKAVGWRRKRKGDVFWLAPGHLGHWERLAK